MKSVSSYLVDWWRLVVPYFRSEERWIAIALLVGAIVLTLASVTVNVAFSEWNRRFYDSLQNKDEAAFWIEMVNFGWIAALAIAFGVARGLVSPYLRLRWRRWLTDTISPIGSTAAAITALNSSARSTTPTSASPRICGCSVSTP